MSAGPGPFATLRAGPFRAVIFDMDGVLVDSEPAFLEAVNQVLAEEGRSIGFERYQRLLGTSVSVTWRGVLEMVGLPADDLQSYVERYEEALLETLGRPRPLLAGVEALIRELRGRQVPIGLATSSRQAWVEALLLGGVGLPLDTFDAVVWRQMVAKSKPAPDLYLKAAHLLAVQPERCVAVEDTPAGIASAKAAGMYAVQVRAASTAFPPIEDADLVIDTLEHFPMAVVETD
ncbi:MAG: hypothetical protein A2148_05175 [Chloroflexi bacterium RBG_16_68_14]|nr:MAG: hypothetical protein A2148_05175 [Chloroflexi bacterium RBG_16_68_14]